MKTISVIGEIDGTSKLEVKIEANAIKPEQLVNFYFAFRKICEEDMFNLSVEKTIDDLRNILDIKYKEFLEANKDD